MTKEEAKEMLGKKQSELRLAERVMEMHENGVRELREEIEELEAIINKKDDWRDKLVQPDTNGFYFIERDKYQDKGFVVEEGYFSERKPEHAFKRWAQAELIMEKMLLMQEMHAFAHVRNGDWVADYKDEDQRKYGIILCENKAHVDHFIRVNHLVFGVAVKSKEIAGEVLKEFGKRIEKIYNKMY